MLEDRTENHNSQPSTDIAEPRKYQEDGFISPFLYFFEYGVKAGMFKNLGEINKLKEENPLYSSYIDQWMANAIKNGIVKIETDGIIRSLAKKVDLYTITGENSKDKVKPVLDVISSQSIKQFNENKESLSTYNFYAIPNDPILVQEYKEIVGEFYAKINNLAKKINKSPIDKVHYLGISTCTMDKEVFNEI